MKKENCIDLQALAGGAFAEKLNDALMKVADNIQDPNTEATKKRTITVSLNFTPNKSRQMVRTQIAVTTKLAATEEIDTQMIMGRNMRTGKIELAEYDGQIRGQMSFNDMPQQEAAPAAAPEAEPVQAQAPQQPTGKPLDLRNRGKKQETTTAELIPGRDYDPNTGEVYESAGQAAEDNRAAAGRVVSINNRAAQA